MKLLFVTATNTNIGKTYATLRLIDHFSQQNIAVGVCKPIETGVEDEPMDAKLLLHAVQKENKNFKNLTPKAITAYTFKLPAAPFSADTNKIISIKKIKNKIKELSKLCELLIIEGAGGLMVPIKANYFMIDLIEELDSDVLLVTPSKLGCINETLLSINILEQRGIAFDWTVNLYEEQEAFITRTQPFYDQRFPSWWDLQNNLDQYVKNYIKNAL